ncbi:MAG: Cys-tRNA(Pro) deacylase [Lentisphaeria bacterium]|nr:Cys-tRNA(Pro) deacylase [Lentisphaeria bacterium]
MKNLRTNVFRLLEAAGIPFEEKYYDVADGRIDAVSIAEKIGESPEQVFKTLVTYSNKKEHFVFVVPAAAELDLKKAAAVAGVKSIEMIPAKTLLPTTGYVHGGCSPVGMKKFFPTFIDETAQLYDYICVSAGAIGTNVAVDPEKLCRFLPAQYADIAK